VAPFGARIGPVRICCGVCGDGITTRPFCHPRIRRSDMCGYFTVYLTIRRWQKERGPCSVSSLPRLPLVSSLIMVASAESRPLRTSNKEAISDIIPNLPARGDDCHCEQIHPANTRILRRATLKIDLYLIPIMGMFCVSLTSTFSSQCSSPVQTFCHSW
jgi:hypothetical protein